MVVFCFKHAVGQAKIYYYVGTFLYKKLLAKLKAVKAIIDWFI